MSYVYIESEHWNDGDGTHCLWTVGFYDPSGKWIAESDHPTAEAAAERTAWLNGSGPTMPSSQARGREYRP